MQYGDLRHWQDLAEMHGCQLRKNEGRKKTFTLSCGERWKFLCNPETGQLIKSLRELKADEWRALIVRVSEELKADIDTPPEEIN
ncbi:hypothetical protein CYR55_22450 [Chimaeribacter californicus]|uniref:Uncharacterized protein n=1 Tax=Chimaeribacter californicus TaxID=2060067 RepID=A0A2N5DU07_9GAMM|nr:hypothetical protein [Chimaeribacter californicus]PLR30104.1 hypothetical protein CYR55_22450 [Chimaeribacter californicus]